MSKNLINILQSEIASGNLLKLVDESLAAGQVLSKLGFSKKGQYVQIVKRFLEDNEIDTSHFTINGKPLTQRVKKICPVCSSQFTTEPRNDKEQVTCSRSCSNTYFRTRDGASTYRNRAIKYYGMKCAKCDFSNLLALEVHHIDKNRKNNSIENLVVLCANCHRIEHSSNISD